MIWKKVNPQSPPPGDFFFAGETLSAPCGGTSPKGGGKGDVGTDCRVGPLGLPIPFVPSGHFPLTRGIGLAMTGFFDSLGFYRSL